MELLGLEVEMAYLSLQHQNHSSYLRNITHRENSMSGLYVPWHSFIINSACKTLILSVSSLQMMTNSSECKNVVCRDNFVLLKQIFFSSLQEL
jgi:hypothetical protein